MLNLQTDLDIAAVAQKPKHSMLPLLTILFVISYGLMVMLIVEQGKTIDTQRYLIRSLFSDSTQLTAIKNGAVQKSNQAKARMQAEQSQAGRQDRTKNNDRVRPLPQRPPKDTSDTADERRSLLTI